MNNLGKRKVEEHLRDLNGWALNSGADKISKTFKFDDFKQAFSFMTEVASKAEEINHHPDWSNVYNEVDVTLTTHDAGGLTEKDLELAMFMDQVAE